MRKTKQKKLGSEIGVQDGEGAVAVAACGTMGVCIRFEALFAGDSVGGAAACVLDDSGPVVESILEDEILFLVVIEESYVEHVDVAAAQRHDPKDRCNQFDGLFSLAQIGAPDFIHVVRSGFELWSAPTN